MVLLPKSDNKVRYIITNKTQHRILRTLNAPLAEPLEHTYEMCLVNFRFYR